LTHSLTPPGLLPHAAPGSLGYLEALSLAHPALEILEELALVRVAASVVEPIASRRLGQGIRRKFLRER
jgi:hypothetical protein